MIISAVNDKSVKLYNQGEGPSRVVVLVGSTAIIIITVTMIALLQYTRHVTRVGGEVVFKMDRSATKLFGVRQVS